MAADKYHVLLVEDSGAHAELIRRAFDGAADRFELVIAPDLAAARSAFRSNLRRFDLVITDLVLPDGRGTELLAEAKHHAVCSCIVLTSHGDEATAVDAIKRGAFDYLVKSPECFERMPHTAERAIRQLRHAAELERAELELRKSEERLAQAQRAAHIGSWEWALEHRLWCSDEALRVAALRPADLEDLAALFERVLPADRAALTAAASATLRHGTPMSAELRATVPERGLRVFQVTGQRSDRPCPDACGRPDCTRRVIGTIQDVTDRKQLQEQVLQSRKTEAVGLLASGIAHDFNNLLMGIRGCLVVAKKHLAKDSAALQPLADALAATEDGAKLTRQLLSFARAPRDDEPRRSEIDALLVELHGMLGRLLGESIRVAATPGAPGAWVAIDRARLQQVIVNLSVNARDAMPDGGTLQLATARVDLDAATARRLQTTAGKHVELVVADTGRGMDEATLARAFEPFFTTKGLREGTGLGMSTILSIVREAGGCITLDSELGVGTTARICLPEAAPEPPALREPTAPAGARGAGQTLLVLEDERLVREAVVEFLTGAGYRVISASDAASAQRVAREHDGPIELIVSDVVLPDGAGPDVVRRLLAERPEAAALYMSAFTKEMLLRDQKVTAHDTVLHKPFDEAELTAKVQQALRAGRARGAPSPAQAPDTRTVLLVEDNAVARDATALLLQDEGYDVLAAASGAQARALFGEHAARVRVLVTDFRLPDVDGHALAVELRGSKPGLGVVFISGLSPESSALLAAALREPRTHFVQKPLDLDELQRVLTLATAPPQ